MADRPRWACVVRGSADSAARRSDRFLTRDQVAEELATSKAQVYVLIRRGDLRALKIGGRGVWRVARQDLEDYIARTYDETERWLEEHPYADGDAPPDAE